MTSQNRAEALVLVLDKPHRTAYGKTSKVDSEGATQGSACRSAFLSPRRKRA